MKKLLAFILSVAILACVFAIPVVAVDDNRKSTYLFMDRFYASYGGMINEFNENETMTDAEKEQYYKELFYHYDESGDVDWVFIFCHTDWYVPEGGYYHIGNRLIKTSESYTPCSLGFAVFDVKDNKFYDISKVWKDEKYSVVAKQFEQAVDKGFSDFETNLIIGDMNYDNYITVSDATYLQKCLAGLEDYPVTPELQMFIDQKIAYDPVNCNITFKINDFYDTNADGTVSISDATKIQRISAEIDE